MKSKFEKELREKAYSAVPDGWDEVEKKAKVFEPSGIINKAKSSPVKTIAAAAAAVAVVIGAGFAIKAMQRSPVPYEADDIETIQAAVTESGEPADESAASDSEQTAPAASEGDAEVFDAAETVSETTSKKTNLLSAEDTSADKKDKTEKSAKEQKNTKAGNKDSTSALAERKTSSADSLNAQAQTVAETTTAAPETAVSMNYTYVINSGKYKDYCPGKVIEKDRVGEKIGSVTVTGYWEGFGAVSENKTQRETLSADVYQIEGVSDDVAVCLKFNDKGDALTTNHYYVVINPKADYSPVREYCIAVPNTRIAEDNTDKNVPTASNPYYPEQSKEAELTRGKTETVTAVTSKAHTETQTVSG